MALGRRGHPRRAIPSAIAPLDTSTIWRSCACRAAIWRLHCSTASMSSPRPSLVTSEEPTLITRRCAPAATEVVFSRSSMMPNSGSESVGRWGGGFGRRGGPSVYARCLVLRLGRWRCVACGVKARVVFDMHARLLVLLDVIALLFGVEPILQCPNQSL